MALTAFFVFPLSFLKNFLNVPLSLFDDFFILTSVSVFRGHKSNALMQSLLSIVADKIIQVILTHQTPLSGVCPSELDI